MIETKLEQITLLGFENSGFVFIWILIFAGMLGLGSGYFKKPEKTNWRSSNYETANQSALCR